MEDIDLRQILHILWQGHNKIMGFICTFLILAVIYLIFAPQVYESNSSMTIQSSDIVNTEKDQNYIGIYAEIIKDPRMLGIDKDEYDKIVKVLVPRQTRIIQLIVSGKDAKEACSKSNQIIANFQKTIADKEGESINRILAIAKNDLDRAKEAWNTRFKEGSLPTGIRSAEEEVYFTNLNTYNNLLIKKQQLGHSVLVTSMPTTPEKPSKPKKVLTIVLAMVIGTVFGCAYCVVNNKNDKNK